MNPWVLPLLPALGAVIGLIVGGRARWAAIAAALGGTGAALLAALVAVAAKPWTDPSVSDLGAFDTGAIPVHVVAVLSGLSVVMALMVCIVTLLVQVYSVEYMRGDPRYGSYAAVVSLFSAAMLVVVVADNLLILLIGWEVMGLTSYLLIGHHWELEGSRAAAVKAFLVTRIGDVAMLVGILVLAVAAGTFEITALVASAGRIDSTTLTAGLLLIALGVAGKSAQFPLHTWLPDAMAGPTPISALIHAATMVAAGIYLVVRLYPLYLQSSTALAVLGVSACITMLGAALVALVEDDIKRVLAWSTVGQLAYMVGALAVGSRDAAMFHLFAHAAFKALLFLCAGVVLHGVGTVSMQQLGGLRSRLPQTALLMGLGLAALAGVPPLAGFFSKESVLTAAEEAAVSGHAPCPQWVAWSVLIVGTITVAITAAYCLRLWLRTFAGTARDAAVAHGHEPGPWMRIPLYILSIPTIGFGLVSLINNTLPAWTGGTVESLRPGVVTTVISLLLLVIGAGLILRQWRSRPETDPAAKLVGRALPMLTSAYDVDRFYDAFLVRSTTRFAVSIASSDDDLVLATDSVGSAADRVGGLLRRLQTGDPQRYLTVGLVGVGFAAVVAVVALALGAGS